MVSRQMGTMNPGRARGRTATILSAAALLGAALLFVPVHPAENDRLAAALVDLLHFPIFALIAAVLMLHPVSRARPGLSVITVAAAMLLFGAAVEWIQPLVGRTREIRDLYIGWTGSVAAICAVLSVRVGGGWKRACLVVLAALCGALALSPAVGTAIDRRRAAIDYPLLASFESRLELGRLEVNGCRVQRSPLHATRGARSLSVEVAKVVTYPGVFLVDLPRDPRAAGSLQFDVHSAAPSNVLVWVRLDDSENPGYRERFQKAIDLLPGANAISITQAEIDRSDRGGRVDLRDMRRWGLFFDNADVGTRLYIDNINLVLDPVGGMY